MPFIWRSFCVQWWILQPCIGKCSRTENFKRISTRFTVEDNNLSFGAHTLCKKCSWRIKKFEAAVKEIANLNWEFYNFFFVYWKGASMCSKCCSRLAIPVSGALCSSTQSPEIYWNNDFPNPVGKTATIP